MIDTSPEIIPRELLFGNPDRAGVRVSPDGVYLSFLAPVDDVLNIWVAPIDQPEAARPVTNEVQRDIPRYFWAYNNRYLLYSQDNDGDENWRIYRVDLDDGSVALLTPPDSVHACVERISPEFPDAAIMGMNQRDSRYHDLFHLDLRTGTLAMVMQNDEFSGFEIDMHFAVRFGYKVRSDGGYVVFRRVGNDEDGKWILEDSIDVEDAITTNPVAIDTSGKIHYWLDSRGRNTAALIAVDLESGSRTELASDDKTDVNGLLQHPTRETIQAVSFNYLKDEWKVIDTAIQPDFDYLHTLSDGELHIADRNLTDEIWIVAFERDNGPMHYYLYHRSTRSARFLFSNRGKCENLPFSSMHAVVIKSRDGLDLVSYYSLPVWSVEAAKADGEFTLPTKPLPMILLVHGGPHGRDAMGFDSEHQFFTNRGYAVLSVNFRASTGFGKSFVNAGNGEWGAKMHDDLIDAVNWAVETGIASSDKIAIVGTSYGGYAALAGLAFTPEIFTCGVDIVGPSNLVTLLETVPDYWKPGLNMLYQQIGNPNTEDGAALLKDRSPLTHAHRIQRPLLIAQGANDPRVKRAESDQIVEAMRTKGIPVTYVLFPDEGHGFERRENRLAFFAVQEAFLALHLGNDRYEPLPGNFDGSSMQLLEGTFPAFP